MVGADTGPPLRLPARSKINLYLHVLGRRPDGYHLLDSLFVFTEFADGVEAELGPELSLTLAGPFGPDLDDMLDSPEDNLMLKAARALAAESGSRAGARLRLEKRIPPAAGLGGGSSDAAAALMALSQLWQPDVSASALARLGLALGADVPACLAQPQSLFVGGIGEELTAAPALPEVAVLLVNPGVALETRRVFAALDDVHSKPARFDEAPGTANELAQLLAERRNDLEAPARALAPEIDTVLAQLTALPGALLSRMSGSGATCFALFAELEQAQAGQQTLAGDHPKWWATATTLANAHGDRGE